MLRTIRTESVGWQAEQSESKESNFFKWALTLMNLVEKLKNWFLIRKLELCCKLHLFHLFQSKMFTQMLTQKPSNALRLTIGLNEKEKNLNSFNLNFDRVWPTSNWPNVATLRAEITGSSRLQWLFWEPTTRQHRSAFWKWNLKFIGRIGKFPMEIVQPRTNRYKITLGKPEKAIHSEWHSGFIVDSQDLFREW